MPRRQLLGPRRHGLHPMRPEYGDVLLRDVLGEQHIRPQRRRQRVPNVSRLRPRVARRQDVRVLTRFVH